MVPVVRSVTDCRLSKRLGLRPDGNMGGREATQDLTAPGQKRGRSLMGGTQAESVAAHHRLRAVPGFLDFINPPS